jgi:uncharacterized protein YjgD (DUF1641 family)
MAEAIQYTVRPPKIAPDAHEELERLLQTCHEHGVLRFANDVVAANTEIARVLVQGLQKEGTLNAIKNISIVLMALSRIPPDDFYRVVFALKDAFSRLSGESEEERAQRAPGVVGAYHMLNDEALWKGFGPLLDALKAFAGGLDRQVENPISAFKSGRSS